MTIEELTLQVKQLSESFRRHKHKGQGLDQTEPLDITTQQVSSASASISSSPSSSRSSSVSDSPSQSPSASTSPSTSLSASRSPSASLSRSISPSSSVSVSVSTSPSSSNSPSISPSSSSSSSQSTSTSASISPSSSVSPSIAPQIAFDASSQGNVTSGSSLNWGWNHTITGSNTVLIVAIEGGNGISGVTWGSENMIRVGSFINPSMWYLIGAHTGVDTITVTQIGNGLPSFGFAASYTGCTSLDSFNGGFNTVSSGNAMTFNTVVVNPNCWLIGFGVAFGSFVGEPSSWASNYVDRQNAFYSFPSNNQAMVLSDTNGIVGTGSQGMTWTADSTIANGNGGVIISLSP